VRDDISNGRATSWFAALDYGFTHYTVVLLGFTDSDGKTFVVDEHAQRGWIPERHAEAIKAMFHHHQVSLTKSYSYDIDFSRFVAGADVFAKQFDGLTIADQYSKLGIKLRPANTDRVNGWAAILHALGDPNGKVDPKLFIHPRCARLIDCLPSLEHDPGRPEDVLKVDPDEDGLGGDDAADALRYLVATRPIGGYVTKLRGL